MANFAYKYSDPSANASGSTPFGIYDSDSTFQSDSITVCKWTARRLGYPMMQVEIYSSSIWACFEEAVSEYSSHINNYNMKNWLWEAYGTQNRISGSIGTGSLEPQYPHLGTSVVLSKQYGQAANVGGDVTLKSGSITLVKDEQDYNLQTLWANVSESSKRIEVQRVYNRGPASITRFYDPFMGSFEQRQMLDNFGFSNSSPAIIFMMRPISYDILRAQMIETSDRIRRSAYSFEIINNRLKLFPRPTSDDAGNKVWFEYYVRDDLMETTRDFTENKVSDPSNIPYKFITYSSINAPGRQWIRKYTLALSKELLGIIRSKYSTLPIPGGEVTIDGESLKAEGREEKTSLLEELREFLDSVSLNEKVKAEAEEAEASQQVLSRAPLEIYIG
jgi:hypothetical protein